jgi:hypothetical protein
MTLWGNGFDDVAVVDGAGCDVELVVSLDAASFFALAKVPDLVASLAFSTER